MESDEMFVQSDGYLAQRISLKKFNVVEHLPNQCRPHIA